jgi:hypothetical protein
LIVGWIEPGDHLPHLDPIADIDGSGHHFAAHAESEIGFIARLDNAGVRSRCRGSGDHAMDANRLGLTGRSHRIRLIGEQDAGIDRKDDGRGDGGRGASKGLIPCLRRGLTSAPPSNDSREAPVFARRASKGRDSWLARAAGLVSSRLAHFRNPVSKAETGFQSSESN